MDEKINSLLCDFQPISLTEMSEIRLMNRLDRKYVMSVGQLYEFLRMASADYYVQQIDGKRINPYRTVYLDTENLDMYLAHHNGRARRRKVRVRTYVDSGISFLEVKNKNNRSRTDKRRIEADQQILNFALNRAFQTIDSNDDDFLQRCSGYSFSELHPALQNAFNRITLVNHGKTERLTIDLDVRFHNFDTELDAAPQNTVILEVKRDGNVVSPSAAMLRRLHIHPCGFSKYCVGQAMSNPHLKQNLFKQKITRINKLSINQRLYEQFD